MPKFRRIGAVVEASQWFKHGDHPAVKPARGAPPYPPGTMTMEEGEPIGFLDTPAGEQKVHSGDWVLPEPTGDGFYPCAADRFGALYEPVE
ncbi:MAG: hypothetical protein ACXWKQ_07375 [Reyranella sp.]